MQTKLNFKQSMKAALLAALSSAGINTLLFYFFHATGIINDSIFIEQEQPLTIIPVIFSSVFPTIIAGIIYFLFEKYALKGFRNFTILTIVLLLISFTNPFMMIKGVTTGYALALNSMHVVVASFLIFWINRTKTKIAE